MISTGLMMRDSCYGSVCGCRGGGEYKSWVKRIPLFEVNFKLCILFIIKIFIIIDEKRTLYSKNIFFKTFFVYIFISNDYMCINLNQNTYGSKSIRIMIYYNSFMIHFYYLFLIRIAFSTLSNKFFFNRYYLRYAIGRRFLYNYITNAFFILFFYFYFYLFIIIFTYGGRGLSK